MNRIRRVLIICHLAFVFTTLSYLLLKPSLKDFFSRKLEALLLLEIPNQITTVSHAKVESPPPFLIAWIFFSILLSFFLLFRIDGAKKAVWILPFCFASYLFFLEKPPEKKVMLPWKEYLISEYAKEVPSSQPDVFETQLTKGKHAYNMERLQRLQSGEGDDLIHFLFGPPSLFLLVIYLGWNIFFAYVQNKKFS